MTSPTVSIVLITFNDVTRLPRALDAALAQTLHDLEVIVVDDCSTDGTEAYVRGRMATDERLRYVRLGANSGGCSAPRNAGIEQARGTWLMFSDSDDELEVHAAKNLLIAAEEADADLACGVVERVEVGSGTRVRWRAELHQPATLDGIGARPELIADTVSVNKLYRRSWLVERGITFPEGLLYEDQLFTMRCYAEANRIAVLDVTVYHWSVERAADELSITQRRHDLRNVRDRIQINRLIDAYLESAERSDLVPVKTEKFLRHDLYLHLVPVLDMPDDHAREVLAVLRAYAATLDLTRAQALRPALRIALYHLLLDDLDGVRLALRTLRWAAVLPTPIQTVDGRDRWACEHLQAGPSVHDLPPAWWLDVHDLRPSRARVTDQRWCHELDALDVDGTRVSVTGHTADAYGRLCDVTRLHLALTDAHGIRRTLPLTWNVDGDTMHWQGAGKFTAATQSSDGGRGALQLHMEIDGHWNLMPVRRAHPLNVEGRKLVFTSADRGVIRWRAVDGRRVRPSVVVQRIAAMLLPRLACLLPARDVVCFASHGGTQCTGAVRIVSQAMHRDHPGTTQVWAISPGVTDSPDGVVTVLPGGWRHRVAAARARLLIDDGEPLRTTGGAAAPGPLRAGRSTRTARVIEPELVRTGRQRRDWPLLTRRQRGTPVRADLLVVPGESVAASLRAALDFTGEVRVAAKVEPPARDVARRRLDLHAASPVVLWAAVDGSVLPIESVARHLDETWSLLVHAPNVEIAAAQRAWVRDVTTVGDQLALISAADVVVTDASSLAARAAAVGRPIVFWSRSIRDLQSRGPGLTIDLEQSPGPVVEDPEALVRLLVEIIGSEAAPDTTMREAYAALAATASGGDTSPWVEWS